MKTLYLKTTMKLLRLLPALIFFMLALSYTARSQYALPNPVCYGQPIYLYCSLSGCDVPGATFTWQNISGSWLSTDQNPVIYPPGSIQNPLGVGYAEDRFYLQVQFAPPPGGFSGGSVKVNLLPEVFVTGTPTNILCFGAGTGSLNITATGGRLPYKYLWSNNSTVRNQTGLLAGTYTVTVTDFSGCTKSGSWAITEPGDITIDGTPSNATCFGTSSGSINLVVDGGTPDFQYLWSNGASTQNISSLPAGSYTVTVTDANNCKKTKSWALSQSDDLILTASQVDVLCFGGSNGSINVSVGGGGVGPYEYLWSVPQTTQEITGLIAGTYYVTVTDSKGCKKSGNWTITEPPTLVLIGQPFGVLCNGGSTGAVNITISGGTEGSGYGFLWSNGEATKNIANLTAGVYTVTVTDANGCKISDSWTVTEPLALALSGTPSNVLCNGGSSGVIDITVSGGTKDYSFAWSNGPFTEDISSLPIGIYTVTVTDANGCTKIDSWQVSEPSTIDITTSAVANSVDCQGNHNGSIALSVTGGTPDYEYLWNTDEITDVISGLYPGDYTVTVTDANHCFATASWTITEPSNVSWEGSVTSVTCFEGNNGYITGGGLGGTPFTNPPPYLYQWSNGETSQNIYNLTAGLYTVTVTDSRGCIAWTSREIKQPTDLMIPSAIVSHVLCNDGSNGAIDISVSGGTPDYTFLWSNGEIIEDITGLTAGVYTVTVTDANQCSETGSWLITEPTVLSVGGTPKAVLCNGGSSGSIDLTVTGGTTDYSFSWSNGESSEDISGLTVGCYSVVVTDANGCRAFGYYCVTQPTALELAGTPKGVLCNGGNTGSIDITVSGGTTDYGYSWSNGESSEDISGLTAGVYTVVVTDANGCKISDSWTVTEPTPLTLTGTPKGTLCNGGSTGSIDITVGGGTPGEMYTFLWSNAAATEDINGLTAGCYTVTVTDANGCKISDSWCVTEPTAISVTGTPTPVLCNGGSTGSIDITVGGGTPDYTYQWSSGPSTEDISLLPIGVYTVTVTDANGCSTTGSWQVTQPPALDITSSAVVTSVDCQGNHNGSIALSVTGGTPDYFYLWNTDETTSTISGLFPGDYTVTVTDANNCLATASWTITEPSNVSWEGSVTSVTCFGGNNGYITGGGLGGTPFTVEPYYLYQWSNGETTQNIYNLTAGNYTVTVTDSRGCIAFTTREIKQPTDLIIPSAIVSNVLCNGGATGAIDISVTGGTPDYTYLWNNGETMEDITGLTAGVYTVTVTDANQCTETGSWQITEPTALSIDGTPKPVLCNGGSTGSIDITVTGGTTDYSFSWSNGELSEDISGLTVGCYSVVVTDANGCKAYGTYCVTEPTALELAGTPKGVLCNGGNTGSIDITVSGGTTDYGYSWSNGESSEDISGLTAGVYTVVVTDANGCQISNSWTVTEPTALSLDGTPHGVLCNGGNTGSIDITINGGTPFSPEKNFMFYSYLWSNGDETEDINGLTVGCYTVTVTDANGCQISGSWCVTEPTALSLAGSTLPVLCNGGNTGSITITVDGGTLDYTYYWSNGKTTKDVSGLTVGCYTVIVTDAHQCQITDSWCISEPTALELAGTPHGVLCKGGNTGSIDITVSGGTTDYGYSWSNGESSEDISGLTAGVYTVVVTDANGCQISNSWTVTEPSALSLTGIPSGVLCNGGSTGSINITVSGGTADYTFEWSNGPATEDITNLPIGVYTVTVTDANGCKISDSWTVTEPTALSLAGTPTGVLCNGGSTGSINITVSGGTPDYTYQWSSGPSTEDISLIPAGVYTVTVTDANGCQISDSWTVTEPTALSVAGTPKPVLCNGGNTGSIDITVTGGTTDYSFSWSNGETSEDLSGLTVGCYSVVVTDANGCRAFGYYCVTQPTALELAGTPKGVLCNGGNTGSIDITVSGGTTDYGYSWSNGEFSEDISGLTAGVYTVVVTDANGCQISNSWTVTEPTALSLEGTPHGVLCNAGNTGSIDITVSGGTTDYGYSWSNGESSEDISRLTVGCYTVTITDANGCKISNSWCVTEPTALSVTGTKTPVLCNGGSNGSIDITVEGGTLDYSYYWSNGETSEDISGLTAGCYTVIVTDAHQCQITDSWCISEPTALELAGTPHGVLCKGGNTGSIDITVSGGTTDYGYSWSNGESSEDISGLTAGVYTVVVTDANGCQISNSWTVTEPSALSLTGIPSGVLCNGGSTGSINITVSGGTADYTFEWSNGPATEDITNLPIGVYTVTVTDANGCKISDSWTVTEPTALSLAGTPTGVLCNGGSTGSINITVSGGTPDYTYQWSSGPSTEDISLIPAGVYTVTVTDANGCQISDSWTVTEPTALSVAGTPKPVLCNGGNTGSIDITVTGGTTDYSFSWSNGETSEDLSGLTVGCYSVVVTDANGCKAYGTYCVTEPTALELAGTPHGVLCNGGNTGSIDITVSGGTTDYGYSWSNGESSEDISGLTAGVYTVVVTDANGCQISNSWTVTEPTALSLDGTPHGVLCNGGNTGSIDITINGGTPYLPDRDVLLYSYLWSNGAETEDINGLTVGCYTVTVTDANGCQISGSWCVTEPTALSLAGNTSPVLCNGGNTGSITITVDGGTLDYTYYWSNGKTTKDVSGLTAGCYTVIVTDAHQCQITDSWCISEPTALELAGTPHGVLCNGGNTGSIDITVSGGTTDYGYSWSNGESSEDISGLTAGVYTVVVTDANGCQISNSWTVTEPSALSLTGIPSGVLCNGGKTGSIDITVSGGTTDYTFEWSNGPATEDITNLPIGVYTVTVTDANGCTISDSWTITEPTTLSLAGTPTGVLCNGGSTGAIDITVSGGTPDYTYQWSSGPSTEDISLIPAGVYTVTVTDANGCQISDSWTVTEPTALSVAGTPKPVLCNGGNTGSVDITVSGGTTDYNFSWSNGETSEDISGLTVGCYSVIVTDANGCKAFGTYCVTEPTALSIELTELVDVTCHGASNGAVYISVSGGTEPYSYIWSSGGTLQNIYCCIPAGCYTVTVTDANLCQAVASYCITEPPAITITGTPTGVACYGDSNGSIDITVDGGYAPYRYFWSPTGTVEVAEDISGLSAGVYTVTVIDELGCSQTGSWLVTSPDQLTVDGTPSGVLCNGGSTGSISITVDGGTPDYYYSWSNGESTKDISGLTVGCYTVVVTDAHQCVTTGSWCVSEPTALSLEATPKHVTCYLGSNGELDLTVTGGTPDYQYLWSNDKTTEDITGLTAGAYTVTVTDANGCVAIGSWLITQPPRWWVNITGNGYACCASDVDAEYFATVDGDPGYLGNCPPCNTFQWVVVGGTITSGWNTNHITVDWDCCTQGSVTVVATKCDGCTVTSTKLVTVVLPPAPIITGPAGVISGETDTYCTPFIADHLYTWTVVGGTVVSGQGTHCITVLWGPYPQCGCGSVTVCESDTYISGCTGCPTNGCTACTSLSITMLPELNNITLSGTVYYKNNIPYTLTPGTPLNNVTLKLRNVTTNTIVATTVSGPNMNPPYYTGEAGYYAFESVPAGNYRLESSYNGAWGGNNATDALLIQLEAGSIPGTILSGLNRVVADVNASLTVTSLDALYVKLRTVGSINSYPAGDWKFETPMVTIPQAVPVPVDIAGLCVGDVNGSHIPSGLKEASFLSVVESETQMIPVEETFAYEIRSNTVAQLGAMTLFMGYDKDRFEVVDVTTSTNDEMKYVIEDGDVAIAWADTKPMSVRNDDQLFTLTMKAKEPIAEATQIFNVKTGSEFASPTGERYSNFDLKMSKVMTAGSSKEFSVLNYPNPFKNNTKIVYTLPESGKVTLVITDMFGKTVRTLVNEFQVAGQYTIPVNAVELNLSSGVYLYRIEAAGATDTFVKVNKMIFTK